MHDPDLIPTFFHAEVTYSHLFKREVQFPLTQQGCYECVRLSVHIQQKDEGQGG